MLAEPFGTTPEALLGLLSVVVLCRFDARLSILRCGNSLPYLGQDVGAELDEVQT